MKNTIKPIFLSIFYFINLTLYSQSPCDICTEAFSARSIILINNFRQSLGDIMPFAGAASGSYIGGAVNNTAAETITIIGFLKGIYDLLSKVKFSFWSMFAVAQSTNTFLGAADSFWQQSMSVRANYYTQMVALDNDFCNCLKGRECANGCP